MKALKCFMWLCLLFRLTSISLYLLLVQIIATIVGWNLKLDRSTQTQTQSKTSSYMRNNWGGSVKQHRFMELETLRLFSNVQWHILFYTSGHSDQKINHFYCLKMCRFQRKLRSILAAQTSRHSVLPSVTTYWHADLCVSVYVPAHDRQVEAELRAAAPGGESECVTALGF